MRVAPLFGYLTLHHPSPYPFTTLRFFTTLTLLSLFFSSIQAQDHKDGSNPEELTDIIKRLEQNIEYTNHLDQKIRREIRVQVPRLIIKIYRNGQIDPLRSGEFDLEQVDALTGKVQTLRQFPGKKLYGLGLGSEGPALYFDEALGAESESKRDQYLQDLLYLTQHIQAQKLFKMEKYKHCPQSYGGTIFEQATFLLINYFRIKQGLKPLEFNPELLPVAREHGEYMARNNLSSNHHNIKDRYDKMKTALNWSKAAENVANNKGKINPAHSAYKQWKHSPGHKHNMMIEWDDERQGQSAIGVVHKDGNFYFTQVFADQRDKPQERQEKKGVALNQEANQLDAPVVPRGRVAVKMKGLTNAFNQVSLRAKSVGQSLKDKVDKKVDKVENMKSTLEAKIKQKLSGKD